MAVQRKTSRLPSGDLKWECAGTTRGLLHTIFFLSAVRHFGRWHHRACRRGRSRLGDERANQRSCTDEFN